jgi:hypothetical protein
VVEYDDPIRDAFLRGEASLPPSQSRRHGWGDLQTVGSVDSVNHLLIQGFPVPGNPANPPVWTVRQAGGISFPEKGFMRGQMMRCPYCHQEFNCHTGIGHSDRPEPAAGDRCICTRCLQLSVVGSDKNAHALSKEEEYEAWHSDDHSIDIYNRLCEIRKERMSLN